MHGFFSVPVDHLHALRELARHFRRYDLTDAVVVSPDLGNAKQAAAFARLLGTGVAVGAKQRFSDDRVSIATIIGNVTDRDVIVLDDEIALAAAGPAPRAAASCTLAAARAFARQREQKAKSVRVACTHGLFSSDALKRLEAQPDVLEITCINTVRSGPTSVCPS